MSVPKITRSGDFSVEKKRKRKLEILAASVDVFSTKGYHETSIEDIIRKSRIARGTFYLYFKSKRDVFDNILDDLLENLDRSIETIVIDDPVRSPVDQLKANLTRVMNILGQNSGLRNIWLHHAWGLDKKSFLKLQKFNRQVIDTIESALKKGIVIGIIRRCETRIIAAAMLGLVKEIADSIETKSKESTRKLIDEIVDFGLNGLIRR